MKKVYLGAIVVIAVIVGTVLFFPPARSPSAPAAVPGASSQGTVKGSVVLGPVCPVERIPPDPNCAPRAYKTQITVSRNIETPEKFMTLATNASGTFSVSLPAGEYVLHPVGGSVYPRCEEKLVEVSAGATTDVVINCDTGIR